MAFFNMRIYLPTLVSLLMILSAPPGFSQTGSANEKRKFQVEELVIKSADDPSSESDVQVSDVSKFFLTANREETSVQASLGFKKLSDKGGDFLFDVVAKGPIGKEADEAELASLDGLAIGFSAEAGVTYLLWNPKTDLDKFRSVCWDWHRLNNPDDSASSKAKPPENWAQVYKESDFKPNDRVTEDQAREILRRSYLAVDRGQAWFLSLRYKMNRKEFKFADPESFEEAKGFKNGSAVTAGIGLLTRSDVFLALSYRSEESYKGGAAKEICSPFGETGNLECRNLVLSAPAEQTKEIVSFEVRRLFGDSFAINPKIYHDLDNDVTGIEVPLYFLKDTKGGLRGGFSPGWRSDTDELTVSAFVSTALKLAN